MSGIAPAESQPEFGCIQCWPPEVEAAWMARGTLGQVAELIDDSHFIVRILACTGCAQRFLSVFEEEIDWVDGDDPQYWTLLPITPEESGHLRQSAASITKAQLNAVGPERRGLRRHSPKGEAPRLFWQKGISVP